MDEVIQWLGKKGLKSQLSRYSKYRGYIEEFYRNGNPNSLTDLEQKFKNLMMQCKNAFRLCKCMMHSWMNRVKALKNDYRRLYMGLIL